MPRYYFHIKRGQATFHDLQGVELSDTSEALEEAERRGRDFVASEGQISNAKILIDDDWRRVLELPLELIVEDLSP